VRPGAATSVAGENSLSHPWSMPTAQAAALLRRQSMAWCTAASPHGLVELGAVAPAFPPEFVPRPKLVGRLRGTPNAAVALIVAPPGYGKSSLLSEWAAHDKRPFVWLRIDSAAGSRGVVDSPTELIEPVHGRRGCVVVVDDADLLAPELLREVATAVLDDLPRGSMLALASRTEPELPTGRLRAHRALVEIRMNDLAMTPAEATTLLCQAGFELECDAVKTLVQRTEGWPAALYLAALSLREHPDHPAGVEGFRGDDHLLSEYLRDDVLTALPAELMSFVVRTSVLEELSGPLCDAVLREHGSALTLTTVARASQLLEPLDAAHERYRWHSLFRDSLKCELRRAEPELWSPLHRRASAWYAEHRDGDRAIEHACAAQDPQRAGELLWDNIISYVTQGRSRSVQRWLRTFTADQIAGDSRLALCAAHGCLAMGNVCAAQRWATNAAAAARLEGAGAWTQSMRAGLAVVEATATRAGASAMRQGAERAYELELQDTRWRAVCASLRGIAEYLSGDRAAATVLLEEAIDLGGLAVPSVSALCLAQLATIAMEQSNWELAGELTDRAATMIVERGLDGDATTALAFAASAASRAHEGRVDEAKRDLRSGMNLLATLGDFLPWYSAEARILLAHASLWLADVIGARTLLAQASRFARRTPDAAIFEPWFNNAWSYMYTLAETSLAGPSALTIAELRVLRFLPSHRSFREIAAQLGVSANTVKTQAHAVYRKLGAASR
jgi:LuxR family transcriptional regulator, maltose regulon positive regulatory protein